MVCRICSAEEGKKYIAREMMFGLRDTFEYFECSVCKAIQIKDFPVDMGKYYPSNYYSFSAAASEMGFIKKQIKKLRDKYAVSGKGIIGKFLYGYFPNESLKSVRKHRFIRIVPFLM